MTSHIRNWKEVKKAEIVKLVEEYPFIAVSTLDLLPANILSVLRKKLTIDAKIIVAKTRVIKLAFKESNVDTTPIDPIVKESVAIIFSKKNPFELFSFVKNNKGETTAKEGDIADQDIIIQAGDSGLPPGPALSSLKGVGLKVQVQGPTISITADKTVAKKGDVIDASVADVLGKLNMKPMKVGMKIIGIFDKAEKKFYASDVLDVDEEELFNNFVLAYQQGLNLSVNAGYFNDVSTELILIKAEREAKAIEEVTKISEEKAFDVETKAPVEEEKVSNEETKASSEESSKEQKPFVEEESKSFTDDSLENDIVEQAKNIDTSDEKKELDDVTEQALEESKKDDEIASSVENANKDSEEKVEK
jgi:large subunit ribosomal protein L10